MKKIPLNSLVLDFRQGDPSEFHPHEIVDIERIQQELIGHEESYFIQFEILESLKNKVKSKLWIGERAIVLAYNLKRYEKESIIKIAQEFGLQVFYLISEDMINTDVAKGDGIAEVVFDNRCSPIQKFTPSQLSIEISKKYSGITVIGDIHGQLESAMAAIHWAQVRNNYIVFLGDVIDFGPKSLECASLVYGLVTRGMATFIIGNHERKIYKWLNKINNRSIKIFLSEANKHTIGQIKNLSPKEKKQWEVKFRSLMHIGRTHLVMDNLIFVHASFSYRMMDFKNSRILPQDLEKLAMFGDVEEDDENDLNYSLGYDWFKEIPKGYSVFIGHDAKNNFSPHIETQTNSQVYFMDTGSGKGGVLSSADLQYSKGKYTVKNFNQW